MTLTHKRIFLNNISNVSKLVVYLAIAFFMTPFYVRTLGLTLYGIWAMIMSVVGYMTLMDLGMQTAVMKYVAEYEGKKDREGLSQVIASALAFYGLIAIVGGSALFVLVWYGLPLFNLDSNYIETVRWVLLIMGLDMFLVFPGTVFQGALTGLQLFYLTNAITICVSMITAGTIYFYLSIGYGLITMALISLTGNIVQYGIFYSLVRWRYRVFKFKSDYFMAAKLKQMISFGAKSFLIMISGRIHIGSDALIVGTFMSAAAVPFYTVPASLINYSRNLLWSMTQSLLPLFSNLEARNDLYRMRSTFLLYTRYTCLCFFPLIALILVYGRPFLNLWMGLEFGDKGGPIINLLALAVGVSAFYPLSGRLLTGTAKQGVMVWTGILSSIVFLGLGCLFIWLFGLSGLAAAFLISSIIPFYFVLRESLAVLDLKVTDYFTKSISMPTCVAAITGVILFGIASLYYPTGYMSLLIQISMGVLLYALLGYMFVLSRNEKNIIAVYVVNLVGNAVIKKTRL